jgi:HD superfamily phosphodiesterase
VVTDKALSEFVLNFLDSTIPEHYRFHDRHHTEYVHLKATEIALSEDCSEEEIRLIQAAALLHDTGYSRKYHQHEEESCMIARDILPRFSYKPDEIDLICSMIMATRIPQTPLNKLEEILADADLEYLGTNLASLEAGKLFEELQFIDPSLSLETWGERQLKFIGSHQYFTKYCRENREPQKQAYLDEITKRTRFLS